MSAIAAVTARRAAALPRAAIAFHAARPFTTTVIQQKSATETVKDGLKSVDRAVSDKIVVGLDAAAAAKEKAKGEAEKVSGKAEGTAEELKGDAQQVKNQAKGEAKETKGDLAGKAQELKGEAKGKAAELKGKAKETAQDMKSNP
ncbi:uncharacterized protein F5Z01DRAFT_677257 [Emericellopsis atlantica]|uniref:LEA domain protein n=1 Tax=Emericellopsis atlantica TaxID=2614577 RepID=A0A9P7ZF92_9HYPO|nr:uncharacterized protein F5Z01DRAFT_677257 [Emericellopsis atlantica]KAG9251004.1 hypothetical protein F5Z01DRAFT_677257 [Emericellopsis atlantica]